MIEHSEKTIEFPDKKFKKKKKEIKVEKEDNDNEENVTDDFSFDEIIQIPDEPIEPDSDDGDELELNIDESDDEDDKEEDKDVDKEEDEEKKQIPDDLLLDVMKMVKEKEKGEIEKEKRVNITIPDEPKVEQGGGSVKRIKLDQHYNFF